MTSKRKWVIGISILVIVILVAIPLAFMLGKSGAVIDSGNSEATPAVSDDAELIDTESPTTEAPTTEAPATEAPTTETPTTEPPVSEPDLDMGDEDDGGEANGEINFDDLLDALG